MLKKIYQQKKEKKKQKGNEASPPDIAYIKWKAKP